MLRQYGDRARPGIAILEQYEIFLAAENLRAAAHSRARISRRRDSLGRSNAQ